MDFFEKFIDYSKQIIKINSVEAEAMPDAPFGAGVKDALEQTLKIAQDLGFEIKENSGYYGFAEVGDGDLFGMLGHLDTVPLGNNWSVDPLLGEVIDGVLYGRGVLDDKAPILACLVATADLIASGHTPNCRIRIIFGCDEESGWKCMDKYLECEELPTLAFTPDGDFPVINCEKGIVYHTVSFKKPSYLLKLDGGDRPNMVMDKVVAKLAEYPENINELCLKHDVTFIDGELCAHGVSAHGSTPQKGMNAFWKLVNLLDEVHGGVWSKLKDTIENTDGLGYGLKLRDEVSGDLTINIGTIKQDGKDITFSLDIRYPVSFTRDQITDVLKSTFKEFEVTQGFYHNPLYIAPDHPLCVALIDAYHTVIGERLNPISIGGGTYARALPTAVAFGPIFPWQTSTIHQKDERCSVKDLKLMYEVIKQAIKNLCF